ncbi:hypothetical protein GWK08_18275 [Leptobacterium flavescens]|uniref:XRE family transcriptional regulator n=1 Tax=Leptobacterium flavescens TaxID=472055 RepID=A0A6P0UR81_9FLAO|nr:hypothetical protein [Leptobacterium flavescens]NER15407.1 hypothetical protein [Leptobacterium flavescens]
MKIVDRIKLFIEYKNVSLRKFDESIGMSKGYMSRQIKSNASVGGDVLEKIIDTYPDLNPIWLLQGKGEMVLPPNVINEQGIGYSSASDAFANTLLQYFDHPEIRKKIGDIIDQHLQDKQD